MDQQQLSQLTSEQASRYKLLDGLFNNPGWQLLMEWAAAEEEQQRQRLIFSESWDKNRVAFGAMLAFRRLQDFPMATEAEFAQIAEARAEQTRAKEEEANE